MLFHQHGQAVQNHKDRMCPWPVSMICPPDKPSQVQGLPYLNHRIPPVSRLVYRSHGLVFTDEDEVKEKKKKRKGSKAMGVGKTPRGYQLTF